MSGLDLLSTYASDSEDDEVNDNKKSKENSERYLSCLFFISIKYIAVLLIVGITYNLNNCDLFV